MAQLQLEKSGDPTGITVEAELVRLTDGEIIASAQLHPLPMERTS